MVIGVLGKSDAHQVGELGYGSQLDKSRQPFIHDYLPDCGGPPGEEFRVVGSEVVTPPDVAERDPTGLEQPCVSPHRIPRLQRLTCGLEGGQLVRRKRPRGVRILLVPGDLVAQCAVENRALIVIFQVAAQFSQSSRDLSAVLGRDNVDFSDQFGIQLGGSVDLVQE